MRFEFEGDPSYFRNGWVHRSPPEIYELPVIRDGTDYLEPNQEYRVPLGAVSPAEYERAVKAPMTFRAQYKSSHGKPRTDTHIVDFSQFRGMLFEPNHLREIAKQMKTEGEDLQSLTEGHAKVQVVTQTREEDERRRDEGREAQPTTPTV